MAFTGHGHRIPSTVKDGKIQPKQTKKCGGPRVCPDCRRDVHRYNNKLQKEQKNDRAENE